MAKKNSSPQAKPSTPAVTAEGFSINGFHYPKGTKVIRVRVRLAKDPGAGYKPHK